VTEAEGEEGLYGEERMEAIMTSMLGQSPKDIAEALMQDIVRHAEDTPRSDDITMLLVRRDT
jgi:serine phosphatase RsbU (regulator of sigma subunit)